MSKPGIQITRTITELQPHMHHRVQMHVSEYSGIDPAIFTYQRFPSLPGEVDPDDKFVNVASSGDLREYPQDEPVGDIPFFRLSYVDLIFRSIDVMDQTIAAIDIDIQSLLDNEEKLDTLGTTTVINFNYTAIESSSSSSSSSSNSSSSEAPYSTVSSSSSSSTSSISDSSSSTSSSSTSSESSSSTSSSSPSSMSDSSKSESSVRSSSSSSESSNSSSSDSSLSSQSLSSSSSTESSSESTKTESSNSESSGGWAENESSSSTS